jgi:bifunctional DNA-binding transcriptional regulator/antitoxin component of YhaV-PrlF toxin-antitoxin module
MATEVRLKLGPDGQVTIPSSVLAHYGLEPEAPLRVVETTSGILLVPEVAGPMSELLSTELQNWQDLFDEATGMFEYHEQEELERK